MNVNDANKIAKIIGTADCGCDTCVRELTDKLNAEFPEFRWTPTREIVERPEYGGPHDQGLVVLVEPI